MDSSDESKGDKKKGKDNSSGSQKQDLSPPDKEGDKDSDNEFGKFLKIQSTLKKPRDSLIEDAQSKSNGKTYFNLFG